MNLPLEVTQLIFEMVTPSYLFLAPVCKLWSIWLHFNLKTCLLSVVSSTTTIKESIKSPGGHQFLQRKTWKYLMNDFDIEKANTLVDNDITWDEYTVVGCKNINFFKWLSNKETLKWDPDLAISSSISDEDFVSTMLELGFNPGYKSCQAAARTGCVEIVKLCVENLKNLVIQDVMPDILQILAEEGQTQALKWANTQGYVCDWVTLDAAIYGGNNDTIQYTRSQLIKTNSLERTPRLHLS